MLAFEFRGHESENFDSDKLRDLALSAQLLIALVIYSNNLVWLKHP